MRIALISDLHANEVALRAVLADIDKVGCDEIICLGDVATLGPQPNAVIQLLRERTTRRILGNHDDFMLNRDLIHTYTESPLVVESVDAETPGVAFTCGACDAVIQMAESSEALADVVVKCRCGEYNQL